MKDWSPNGQKFSHLNRFRWIPNSGLDFISQNSNGKVSTYKSTMNKAPYRETYSVVRTWDTNGRTLQGIWEIVDTGRVISFITAEKATRSLDEGEAREAAACIPART